MLTSSTLHTFNAMHGGLSANDTFQTFSERAELSSGHPPFPCHTKVRRKTSACQPEPVGVLLKLRGHLRNLAQRSGIAYSRVTDAGARSAPREWKMVCPAGSLRTWARRKEKPAVSPIAAQNLVQAGPGLG